MASAVPTVCEQMDRWPRPVPGLTLDLPVMGVVFQVRPGQVCPGGAARLRFHLFGFQIRIPSKTDKPGGSPVGQRSLEVSSRPARPPLSSSCDPAGAGVSLQDSLPAPTLLPTLHELDLFRWVLLLRRPSPGGRVA